MDRKKLLEDELSKLGLKIRHDSRLCYSYINHQTSAEWTAGKVARECAVMHWLYNYTTYEDQCRLAAAEVYGSTRFTDGREFAEHMKRHVYPAIKESVMTRGDGCPTRWPWE
ncbi:unnamed protein product [Pylaiella littoralis]